MGQLRSALRAYDPATAELRVATAGHLPPLLSGPAQTTRYLELDAGLPLGVGDIEFVDTTLTLPGQTTLVLCTDGLVESRQRSLSDGLEHLAQVVAVNLRPEQTCQHVLEQLHPADHDSPAEDDIALLVATTGSL